jgi:hypothetical protein
MLLTLAQIFFNRPSTLAIGVSRKPNDAPALVLAAVILVGAVLLAGCVLPGDR